METSIGWCLKKGKGIRIVERNSNLSQVYLRKADNSLRMMALAETLEWKIVAAYYSCYNALYSLLQITGIKSEIHDCTILLMSFFDFTQDEIFFMKKLKELRIDTQYYDRAGSLDEQKVREFVTRCKELLLLSDFDIIRNNIVSIGS